MSYVIATNQVPSDAYLGFSEAFVNMDTTPPTPEDFTALDAHLLLDEPDMDSEAFPSHAWFDDNRFWKA